MRASSVDAGAREGTAFVDPRGLSSGDCSLAWPCRSISEALGTRPAAIALASGATFSGPIANAWEISGELNDPFVVSTYGGTDPAVFETRAGQSCLMRRRDVPVHDVEFRNITCVSIDRDFRKPGFRGPVPGHLTTRNASSGLARHTPKASRCATLLACHTQTACSSIAR